MKNSAVITTSVRNSLVKKLREYSHKYKLPKNKIIEKALDSYFDRIKRAEYVSSFRRAKREPEMQELAEQGLDDFLKMIESNE